MKEYSIDCVIVNGLEPRSNRAVLARCFPDREVIGIDCTDLVLGLGTFHCLTQQVPVF